MIRSSRSRKCGARSSDGGRKFLKLVSKELFRDDAELTCLQMKPSPNSNYMKRITDTPDQFKSGKFSNLNSFLIKNILIVFRPVFLSSCFRNCRIKRSTIEIGAFMRRTKCHLSFLSRICLFQNKSKRKTEFAKEN